MIGSKGISTACRPVIQAGLLMAGLAGLVFSCRSASAADKLTVAVAANAAPAVEALAALYREQHGWNVDLIIGSSGKLSTQIRQGAPFDLFLSADLTYPQALIDAKMAVLPLRVYARGRLVLWLPDTTGLARAGLSLLQAKRVRRIALAQPSLAPYGRAARQALAHSGLWQELQPKLVFGESISQVNQVLSTGAVDAGFTALSAMHYTAMADRGGYMEVDTSAYAPIDQGMVVTRHGATNHPEAARSFFDFLQSEDARRTLAHFGYGLLPN